MTLKEWLRYAEHRVPGLYLDIRLGRAKAVREPGSETSSRDATPADANWAESVVRRAQTPSLFDFRRQEASAVMVP